MSNELLTIKASFGEDIRRFSVDRTINFTSLTNLVNQLFHLTDKNGSTLMYIDNEGDFIKLSTEVELEEAKRCTTKSENTTLRLQVNSIPIVPQSDKGSKESNCSSSTTACESECSGMKYIGIILFALGFFCRPMLAVCFLAGYLFLNRRTIFRCGSGNGRKRWGNCGWNRAGSGCSWNLCSMFSNNICSSWGCDESPKPVDPATHEITKEEQVITEEKKEEKSAPINWQHLLKQLQEMGFANVKQNVQLLTKHNGNIDNTVTELVQLAQ